MSLSRKDCYVGMKVDLSNTGLVYAGAKPKLGQKLPLVTGKIVKLPKSRNVYLETLCDVRRTRGRKIYKKGELWRFNPSQLMALTTPAEPEPLKSDAPEDPDARIAEVMALLDNCTDGVEEFVYLRELHRLLKAKQ